MKKYSIAPGFAKISLFFTIALAFIIPSSVLAVSTITSVTLNNAATVSVVKGSTVSAKVNLSYTSSSTWGSTGWRVSGTSGTLTCNTAASFNNIGSGTNSSTFSITAPNTVGTYNAYFTAYSGNSCNGTAIATKTLTNAVTTTADVTAPIISQVTPVTTPTTDTTPNYTFKTNEAGTIVYGGDCSSNDTSASTSNNGNNTLTFNTLALGTHSNCTIVVKDSSNNSSTPLSVSSFTIVAPTAPDLTVVKTNNVSGSAAVGTPFNWTLTITNSGTASATFANTNTILTDNMPTSGATYGVVATTTSGVTGTFGCSITSSNLTCTAKNTVTIPAGATITITVPVTPTTAGSLVNPRTSGSNICKVDAALHVSESNENNNTCANTVSVMAVVTNPPTVVSINRAGASPTDASTVSWSVNFTTIESVAGVDANDFSLIASGVTGASITNVTGSGSGPYIVTANTGTGSGTLGLNLVDNDSIVGASSGNKLGGTGAGNGNFTGQVYSINKTVTPPPVTGTNLIANPQVETPSSTAGLPDQWQHGGYGTNDAVFTYPVTNAPASSISSGNAVKITITTFTDGDAKWFFKPVAVEAGRQYVYTDSYISATSTQLTAEYFDANGVHLSFGGFTIIPKSPIDAWRTATATFTVPAGAAYMTVFHVILGTGDLTTDNYSLIEAAASVPLDAGMVTFSFDDGWKSQYENAFPILQNAGFHGSFYIITNTLADASPTNNPNILCNDPAQPSCDGAVISVTPSKWTASSQYPDPAKDSYTFSDSYTATTTTTVTVSYFDVNGQPISGQQNVVLATLGPGTSQIATVPFTIPASVFGLISTTTGSSPSFTLSHSVGAGKTISVANPKLIEKPGTEDGYMNATEILALQSAGHEVSAHTQDHCDLVKLNDDPNSAMTGACASVYPGPKTAVDQINGSRSALLALSLAPVDTFAYPYGSFDANIELLLKQDGFIGARSVLLGYNTRASDLYALNIQLVDKPLTDNPTALSTVQSWVDYAKQNKVWLILTFHNVETVSNLNANTANDPTTVGEATTDVFFQNVVNYVKQSNICVVTVHDGLNILKNVGAPCTQTPPPPPTNHAPVLQAVSNQSVATGTLLTFTATATDPDVGDVLTYGITPLPTGATFDTSTGVFSWTATDSDVGDHPLTVSVSDGNGGTDSKDTVITVTGLVTTPTNTAPVANDQTISTIKNNATSTILVATDAENNTLTYATSTSPAHGTLSGILPNVTYTPDTDFVGSDSFTFTASDASATSTAATVSITVTDGVTIPTCPTHFTLDVNNICQPDTTAPVCPADTTLTDGMCVGSNPPVPPTCPVGSTLTNNTCVTPPTDPVCPADTTLTSGQCVTAPTAPTCPAEFTFDTATQQCVSADPEVSPVSATCPDGTTLTDSQCVTPPTTPTCPVGSILTDTQCVTPDSAPVCPADTTLTDGMCAPTPTTPTCPVGFALNANLCVATTDTIPPVITLNGLSTINLTTGDTYTDPGATAVDNIDSSTAVTIGGNTVNTAVAGTYTVTYDAVDSSGNHAIQIMRTVIVSNPAPAPASGGGGGGGGGGGNGPIVASTQSYGIADFNAIIVNWGKTGSGLPGDLNNDGKVDILDFNLLLINWAK